MIPPEIIEQSNATRATTTGEIGSEKKKIQHVNIQPTCEHLINM